MVLAIGVDGFRGPVDYKQGWVAVWISDSGFERATVHKNLSDLLNVAGANAFIGVDIPIGIPEQVERQADECASKFLPGGAAAVFRMPPRSALSCATFQAANTQAKKVAGKGLTPFAYALRNRIIEVESLRGDKRIFEVHPEVSFRAMTTDHDRISRKKSWDGQQSRIELLKASGICLPPDLGEAGMAGVDDLLDAAAGAWTARRKSNCAALSLPATPQPIDGYPTAIWY